MQAELIFIFLAETIIISIPLIGLLFLQEVAVMFITEPRLPYFNSVNRIIVFASYITILINATDSLFQFR